MPTLVAYKFRGIQEYISRGGRLLDIAGGSEVIDSLCRAGLGKALAALELGEQDRETGDATMVAKAGTILQAASGTLLLLFKQEEDAGRFARLWPLLAEQWAPLGRHAVHLEPVASATGAALAAAVSLALARVSKGPELTPFNHPPAAPTSLRASRTGLPVVEIKTFEGDPPEDRDASTHRRRELMIPRGGSPRAEGQHALKERFGFSFEQTLCRDTDALAGAAGARTLAVIHADGSGFGAKFRSVMERHGPEAVSEFARLVREILQEAATRAVEPVRALHTRPAERTANTRWGARPDADPTIACRPILLGGDDMTVVVPGAYGLVVAETFLTALEDISRARLREEFLSRWPMERDGQADPSWRCLRASAGIAYTHARFPFDLALHLAESIAGWVKGRLRPVQDQTSGLAFHRALDSDTGSFDVIFDRQYRAGRGVDQRELTAAPYVTALSVPPAAPNLVTIAQLRDLEEAAAGLPRSAWRDVARLVRESDVAARRRMKRVFEVLGDSAGGRTVDVPLQQALDAIGGKHGMIWSPTHDSRVLRTPVQDVDVLLALRQRQDNHPSDAPPPA